MPVSLSDDLTAREDVYRAKNDLLQEELGRLRRVVGDQAGRIEQLERLNDYQGRALRVPRWLSKPTAKRDRVATLVTVLSDCHFDEVVNPAELDGRNAYNREIADLRIHGTTGEKPLERFQRSEAGTLLPLNGRPSYLAEQEFSRRVARDCCVQVEGNWYSVPAALVRQNVTVQIRDQQVLIRQGGRIVARHTRQTANQRSRQVDRWPLGRSGAAAGDRGRSERKRQPGGGGGLGFRTAFVAGAAPERLRGRGGGGGLMPRGKQGAPTEVSTGLPAAEPADIARLVEELDAMLTRLRLGRFVSSSTGCWTRRPEDS